MLSSRPTVPVDLSSGLDKIAHFGAYLVLGILLSHGASRYSYPAAIAVVLGVLYGVTDEYHQSFVIGRTAELGDWIADALGAIAGVLIHRFTLRRARPGRDRGPALESST